MKYDASDEIERRVQQLEASLVATKKLYMEVYRERVWREQEILDKTSSDLTEVILCT